MRLSHSTRCACLLLLSALAACDNPAADDPDGAPTADAAQPDGEALDALPDGAAPDALPDAGPDDLPDALPDAAPGSPAPPVPGALVFDGPVYYLTLDGQPSTRVGLVGVNTTPEPMVIDSIALDGDAGFTVEPSGAFQPIDAEFLADPDDDGEPGLAPGGELGLTVMYAAADDAPARARLRVMANDSPVDVIVIANRSVPCVRPAPRTVVFRQALTNRADERPLVIESCGYAAARVMSLSIRGDDAFALADAPDPSTPFGLPIRAERRLGVTFFADTPGDYAAELVIESDDAEFPTQVVPLMATALTLDCPVAAVAEPEIAATVGETVVLDGSPSTDPQARDGQPVQWTWSISERPDGAEAEVVESAATGEADDIGTPTAELVPDVAGRYVVDLQVRSFTGLTAPGSPRCDVEPVQIVIDAAP